MTSGIIFAGRVCKRDEGEGPTQLSEENLKHILGCRLHQEYFQPIYVEDI